MTSDADLDQLRAIDSLRTVGQEISNVVTDHFRIENVQIDVKDIVSGRRYSKSRGASIPVSAYAEGFPYFLCYVVHETTHFTAPYAEHRDEEFRDAERKGLALFGLVPESYAKAYVNVLADPEGSIIWSKDELFRERKLPTGITTSALRDSLASLMSIERKEDTRSPREKIVDGLQGDIKIVRQSKLHAWQKNEHVSKHVFSVLQQLGSFYQTKERTYWFNKKDHRLYDVTEGGQKSTTEFANVVAILTDINPRDSLLRYVTAHINAHVPRIAAKVEVHRMAHWDGSYLFIDRFNGSMYRVDENSVETVSNGTNGVLFLPDLSAEPITAATDIDPSILREKLISLLCVNAGEGLSADEVHDFLEWWLLASFFRSVQPTKPIICLWGEKGTSKTTTARALGLFLLGKNFNVATLTSYKQDAFEAHVTATAYAAFDNVDGTIKWLPNRLAALATGDTISKRQLFTTLKWVRFPVDAWIILTSRDPRFGRDDVVERLLIFPTRRPLTYREEGEIQKELLAERGVVWGGAISRLQQVIGALKETPRPKGIRYRMADFASFVLRIQPDKEAVDRAKKMFKQMSKLQDRFMAETTAAIWVDLLLEIVEQEPIVGATSTQIQVKILQSAEGKGVPLSLTPQAVGRKLASEASSLVVQGLKISRRLLHGRNVYDVELTRAARKEHHPKPPQEPKLSTPASQEFVPPQLPQIGVKLSKSLKQNPKHIFVKVGIQIGSAMFVSGKTLCGRTLEGADVKVWGLGIELLGSVKEKLGDLSFGCRRCYDKWEKDHPKEGA